MECMKSELDIFASLPVQTSILRSEEVAYNPLASLEASPSTIEFVSLGNGDTYRDLSSTYIKFKVQILKKDGSTWSANDKIGSGADAKLAPQPSVINNLLHSMIKQCNVTLNGKNITPSDSLYHYKAYLTTLLNYGSDSSQTHLEASGWELDKPNFNSFDNNGSKARQKLYNNSAVVELMGKLHVDFFNTPTLLLNNVDMRIALTLEKQDFFLFFNDTDESYLKIHEATLYMKHVTINPNILLAHNTVLEKANAKYHYKRNEIKTFTIPANTSNILLDNVFIGQIPRALVFCMVNNENFNGKRSKNPYFFDHQNLSQFQLYVNGVPVPNSPIETNFSSNNFYNSRAYLTLFSGTGIHHSDRGHQITKEMFTKGCTILAFDLSADGSTTDSCQNLLNQGTVKIEARLSSPLVSTLTCIVFAEFDASIEIDKNRNVYLNI